MPPPVKADAPRLLSLDAYRGFVMLAMASNGLGFYAVYRGMVDATPGGSVDPVWQFLGLQFEHVPWVGCSFWDLIQPSFIFMVGVAMPYSHASRVAKGDSPPRLAWHVIYRSLVLIALGVFLTSAYATQPNFIFTNVLAQIGLGYAFVYLLIGRGLPLQFLALTTILVGYWLFFFLYPEPGPDFNWKAVGVDVNKIEPLTGIMAHWNKNANAASAFDQWFLNLFPTKTPFVYNGGGYTTLNFIPSMATMLLGLMAGELLRQPRSWLEKLLRLIFGGLVCLTIGMVLGGTVCPLVKRIWTPSWALYSSGWTFLMLAGFYAVIDVLGWYRWAFPLTVVGMNSIAMYIMAQGFFRNWVRDQLKIYFGPEMYKGKWFGQSWFDAQYQPIAEAIVPLFMLWLICWWMYRQRIFVRI